MLFDHLQSLSIVGGPILGSMDEQNRRVLRINFMGRGHGAIQIYYSENMALVTTLPNPVPRVHESQR
ncbi:hypothetical protein D3C73_1594520 [compost metagenome]